MKKLIMIVTALMLSGMMFSQEYHWTAPNSSLYDYRNHITAQVKIDGELQASDAIEIAAFIGDEVRGVIRLLEPYPSGLPGQYYTYLTIFANQPEIGETITLKAYDHDTRTEYGNCQQTFEFSGDEEYQYGGIESGLYLEFVTDQTFTKEIAGYTENSNNHYYLIASPIGEVAPENVAHMLENNFDLYYFDQSSDLEWINYKGDDGNFNLVSGTGYLYANSSDVTLTFTGFPYSGDGEVTLTKDEDCNLSGWNLVGNPFADTAYIDREFYVMNDDGTDIIAGERNSVAAMEGIFVVAETDGETLTFSTEPTRKVAALVMNVTHNRGTAIDRAIVRFNEGGILPKFQLNENNTKLYIPVDGMDYAVVNANTSMGEMPVNFKAAENGTYTLSFSTEEVSFEYLHLIDNLTGTDIDLLQTPSYTFKARTTDYTSRFKLVFATNNNSDDENFAYIDASGNLVIKGEDNATLQIVDALGHVLISRNAKSRISTNGMASGIYVLRLINGNNVKTQKIVID